MRRWGFVAAAVLTVASGSAAAAEPVVAGSALPGLCGWEQAGPFRFGAPRAEARPGPAGVTLDRVYAPFTGANLVTTSWSDAVMLVEFRAKIAEAEAGLAAEAGVASALEKAGWTIARDAPREPAPSAPEIADASRLYSRTIDGDGAPGLLYAGLSWRGGRLTLACARADLLALDRREAEGVLPDGAQRPVPPSPITATPITADQCKDAATRDLTTAVFNGGADPYVDQVTDQRAYWDRLARWFRWRLEKSGKADAAQLDELQFAAEDASREDAPADPLAAVLGLIISIPQLEDARKSNDARQICAAYAETAALLTSDLLQRTERSKRLSAVWAAEAARLGVGLD
ncbi:hypothetical protein [Sphingopyxis sp.]|jgi:hypothetical protein|uniref:hypothetical protein n=1 Tax=Sphingopyxis sp. TaxID=1908224 RepID=UPI003F70F355